MICLILLQISFAENILLYHEKGLENVEFMWNVEFFQSSAFIEFQWIIIPELVESKSLKLYKTIKAG